MPPSSVIRSPDREEGPGGRDGYVTRVNTAQASCKGNVSCNKENAPRAGKRRARRFAALVRCTVLHVVPRAVSRRRPDVGRAFEPALRIAVEVYAAITKPSLAVLVDPGPTLRRSASPGEMPESCRWSAAGIGRDRLFPKLTDSCRWSTQVITRRTAVGLGRELTVAARSSRPPATAIGQNDYGNAAPRARLMKEGTRVRTSSQQLSLPPRRNVSGCRYRASSLRRSWHRRRHQGN